MSYRSTVLEDSPDIYFSLDGTGLPENLGTSAGTGTITQGTAVTTGHAGATTFIGGQSRYFPGNTTQAFITRNSYNYSGDFTVELWYKNDTGSMSDAKVLFRMSIAGNNYWEVTYTTQSGYLRLGDTSGINDGITYTPLGNGAWHHLVVTKSGSLATFYVDGVSRGTVTGTTLTRSNATAIIGMSNAVAAIGGYVDEFALYKTSLSSARVAKHYQDGTQASGVSIVNQAPAMSLSMTAPDATSRIGVYQYAPAQVVNVTMPGGQWIKRDHREVPPPMTLSASTPDAVVKASNPYIPQTVFTNADRGPSTSATTTTFSFGSGSNASRYFYMKFDGLMKPGQSQYTVASAVLHINQTDNNGVAGVYIRRITSDWVEGDYSAITVDTSDNTIYQLGSTNGEKQLNVSKVVESWKTTPNYGIALEWAIGAFTINTRESASSPHLNVDYDEFLGTPVTVQAPASSLSVLAPDAYTHTDNKQTVPALNAISLSMSDANVVTTRSVSNLAPAMVLNLDAPGGVVKVPDQTVKAESMLMNLSTPNANVIINKEVSVVAPVSTLNVTTPDAVFSNLTNVTVFAPVVAMTLRLPTNITVNGAKPEDRYSKFVRQTIDNSDYWYKLEETTGTIAYPVNNVDGFNGKNATYAGGPTLNVLGPQDRRAVAFDGVDDVLEFSHNYKFSSISEPLFSDGNDITLEFSIQTSQLTGTIARGEGGAVRGQDAPVARTNTGVKLVNGELVIVVATNSTTTTYNTRKFISDGKWHHVVISAPRPGSASSPFISGRDPFFVTVDGEVVFTRYDYPVRVNMALVPFTFMANADATINGYTGNVPNIETTNERELLSGSLRDVIVRINYAVTRTTANRLYYEWVNALLVNAEPMTLSLSMGQDTRSRSNIKKMLCIYGLPFAIDNFSNHLYTYRSIFANYFVNAVGVPGSVDTGPGPRTTYTPDGVNVVNPTPHTGGSQNSGSIVYDVKPFRLADAIVYPVHILDAAKSAPGVVSYANTDEISGQYIDNVTGLPRFFDINKDLNIDREDIDIVTVMNFPAASQKTSAGASGTYPETQNLGLTQVEYTKMRENFADSLLDAAAQGSNLWINEPEMAVVLGFITGYDVHDDATFSVVANDGRFPDNYSNVAGHLIAQENKMINISNPGRPIPDLANTVDYYSGYQANHYRRVVSTEPGLTDIESWDIKEGVIRYNADIFKPKGEGYAYNLIYRDELKIGDLVAMSHIVYPPAPYDPSNIRSEVTLPRTKIISARPDGIVGKVITREQNFTYGPGPRNAKVKPQVQNPFRNNAVTIAAEAGTVVKGRSITGRAFIEFMDTDIDQAGFQVDKSKNSIDGREYPISEWLSGIGSDGRENGATFWDYDSDRVTQVVANVIYSRIVIRDNVPVTLTSTQSTFTYASPTLDVRMPHVSMGKRGIKWLTAVDAIPAGDVKVYAPSAEINITTFEPQVTQTRNISVGVTGSMRLDIDFRKPENVFDVNVSEKTTPMVLNLELIGLGKNIKVEPMELNLFMPNPTAIRAGGDRIPVYLDDERRITIYLKENF